MNVDEGDTLKAIVKVPKDEVDDEDEALAASTPKVDDGQDTSPSDSGSVDNDSQDNATEDGDLGDANSDDTDSDATGADE